MALELLYAALLLLIATCISLLVSVPLYGAMVRFRSNYTPLGLHLDSADAEGGAVPHVGPVVNSYFAMLLRVKRIEGWSGLYKGLVPMALANILVTVFAAVYVGTSVASPGSRYALPGTGKTGLLQLIVYTMVFALIQLPMTIIINRAITTPYRLPAFAPKYALGLLLTPLERSRPWVLLLTPGLVAAQTLHILFVLLILHSFRRLLLPSSFNTEWWTASEPAIPSDFTVVRFCAYFFIVALSTLVLCPLEVITTRLSLQRNHAPTGGFSAVPQEDPRTMDLGSDLQFAGEEDVIGLRSEEDPYTGLADCARRILAEEGKRTLFRAWWLTLSMGVLSSFA